MIVIEQEDGAALKNDANYVGTKAAMFAQRGWITLKQAPMSPETNVKDACIFPAMAKSVSATHALQFGTRQLKEDELDKIVKSVFLNTDNLVSFARAYAGHWQMICAIVENEGKNNYLRSKGGRHFNICANYIQMEDGTGVEQIILPPREEDTVLQAS